MARTGWRSWHRNTAYTAEVRSFKQNACLSRQQATDASKGIALVAAKQVKLLLVVAGPFNLINAVAQQPVEVSSSVFTFCVPNMTIATNN